MSVKQLIFVSTWFQILWFVAVLGRESWQWLALLLVTTTWVASYVAARFNLYRSGLILVIGVVVDYLNMSLGLFSFSSSFIPLWLIALWGIFAWYAFYLYPIVSRFPLWSVSMVGGVAGALSYLAGAKLGAVSFGLSTLPMLATLFVQWVAVIYLIVKVLGYESRFRDGGVSGIN
ncbi:DUF2878 domain-containing protein [Vibrio sp. JPW-9-11-11]|uniref:DUF2878 domain-containing protein n=1 Tax=Vibrio sp. JPW-9-11-11 TaxID=1416532 RepID=UPI0015938A16|nr:DUF2878 domain-containing protein [Vibrio sp. JPW-9-11-11]